MATNGPGTPGQAAAHRGLHFRAGALLASAVALHYLLTTLPRLGDGDSHSAVVMAWLAAQGLFLLALGSRRRNDPVSPAHDRAKGGWHPLALVALAAGAGLLRIWSLDSIPHTLSGDEASQGLEALRVLAGEIRNPFATGWLGVPTLSFFFNSISIAWLGPDTFALRLPWALVGTLTIPVTFALMRRLHGSAVAWISATLLAVYHYHIHYSRLGSNQVADPLFLALALWLLYRGMDLDSRRDWALSGMVAGLALYFYAGGRLTMVVLAFVLIHAALRGGWVFLRRHWGGMLTLALGFAVSAAPMLQYALRFPEQFNARVNAVGIFHNGWLEQEMALRGAGMAEVLFDQFRRAALAFNVYPDRTVWYGLPEPLLDPVSGALFLLGLAACTLNLFRRGASQRLAPIVIWWWLGMVFGGMLTDTTPSSQRLITLAVPVTVFIAVVMNAAANRIGRLVPGRRVSRSLVSGFAVLAFATISLYTYFIDYTPRRIAGGPHAELATDIAPRLRTLAPDHDLHFVGAPFMYWGFATLPYLVSEARAGDIVEPLQVPCVPGCPARGRGLAFILHPARADELDAIRSVHPDGLLESYRSAGSGGLLGLLYVVPAVACQPKGG